VPTRAAASLTARPAHHPRRYRVRMFWPLIGGFIAFVLLTVLIGWLVDPARRRDGAGGEPPPGPPPHRRV